MKGILENSCDTRYKGFVLKKCVQGDFYCIVNVLDYLGLMLFFMSYSS